MDAKICDACFQLISEPSLPNCPHCGANLRATIPGSDLIKEIESIVLTTTPTIPGLRVLRVVDVITAECVLGVNIWRDMLASLSDVFGMRSGAMQDELRTARQTCLKELRAEAFRLGANAVVGVKLDYSEISGGAKSMLFLVASGTAVVCEPTEHT
jgi:uncharacterized protein YbjQ (UPF0145 family)